ncbi:MAG: methionine aminotransferase [Sediminicola sp.]
MIPSHPSKLPQLGTTIFTTMGQLAQKHGAINLSQGYPNFDPDPFLVRLVTKAMKQGHNQYAPMAGIPLLCELITEKIYAQHGHRYDPYSEITITAGATQAIFSIITAFISAGDEVIVLKPAYDCYEPAILVNGGIPVHLQLHAPKYKINWEELAGKIGPRTKMLIINTPHNPSGTLLSESDMLQLQECVKGTDILILSDEVYEHIVFDGQRHQSVSKFAGLAERSFICSSFGKTFHITGWKIGYCVGPRELMEEMRKVHQFNVFCANTPIQHALANYLKDTAPYLELNAFYEAKRNLFLSGLEGSRFSAIPASGTYFQLLDYSKISNMDDVSFAKKLTISHKIAGIPISVFNREGLDQHYIRFCFAKTDDTLKRATDILRKL